MAAQKMAADFFANFNAALEAKYPPPATPEPAAAPAEANGGGFLAGLIAWFKRLFGG